MLALLGLCTVFLPLITVSRSTTNMTDVAQLTDWYEGYVKTFVAGDTQMLAEMYAGVPAIFMISNVDGSLSEFSACNVKEAAKVYHDMHVKLSAAGFVSAKMDPIHIQKLTQHVFVLTTAGIRFKADGSELVRIKSAAYLVKRMADAQSPCRITSSMVELSPPHQLHAHHD